MKSVKSFREPFRKTWITAALLLALVTPFYLWDVYAEFFEERPGYLYDPSTGDLYRLSLGPRTYWYRHWERHLVPFSSPSFTQIVWTDHKGALSEELGLPNRRGTGQALLMDDGGLEADTSGPITLIDVDFSPRDDLDPESLLPAQWRRLPQELQGLGGKVWAGDAIVSRRSLPQNQPIEYEVLREVLFLSDDAAMTINTLCFAFTKHRWPECD